MRALAVVCALGATASAQPLLDLRIEGADVHARVRGADKSELVELRAHGQPTVPASKVRGFADAGPVGIAFVLEANEISFGLWNEHESWTPEVDVFTPIVEAFDRLPLASTFPSGSEAMLVTYSTGATVTAPWQPVAAFRGSVLGTRQDWRGGIGTDMVAGIELALNELDRKAGWGRKIVFVVGDGNDTNNEVGKHRLLAIGRDRPDVMVVSLIVRTAVSPESNIISLLTPFHRVANAEGVEAGMKKVLEYTTQQFDATFSLGKLAHDGASHEFTLRAGGADIARAYLTLPPRPPQPLPRALWRWGLVAGVVSALGLVALVMFRSKGPR